MRSMSWGKARVLAAMLVLFALQAGAVSQGKFLFGGYAGWSFGLGDSFRWHLRSHYSDRYRAAYHLGLYGQYDFSTRFGLQLNANYQRIAHDWEFSAWGEAPSSGTDGWHFVSFSLNGVCTYLRLSRASLYLVGGAGIGNGEMYGFDGDFFIFTGGTGIRIFVKPKSSSAVTIGGTFHHLLDPDPYGAEHAGYVRFHIGFEFDPLAGGD